MRLHVIVRYLTRNLDQQTHHPNLSFTQPPSGPPKPEPRPNNLKGSWFSWGKEIKITLLTCWPFPDTSHVAFY